MSATCPNGHLSAAEDYCDTCGAPIAASAEAAGAAPAPTEAAAPAPAAPPREEPAAGDGNPCPHCGTENVAGALFCEACGYDFTTGAMPRGAETAPTASPSSVQNPRATAPSSVQNPPSEPPFEWVAEVWVDPDWYRTQEVDDPCPSPALPTIVPLRRKSVLLGRVSASKNTHPEIELSSDPGVSRRHAQLTTDGARWFVEDLDSSNGTFVGPASGALPEQSIPVGPKTELGDDDRLYVGAWTRVVVRRATDDEIQTYA